MGNAQSTVVESDSVDKTPVISVISTSPDSIAEVCATLSNNCTSVTNSPSLVDTSADINNSNSATTPSHIVTSAITTPPLVPVKTTQPSVVATTTSLPVVTTVVTTTTPLTVVTTPTTVVTTTTPLTVVTTPTTVVTTNTPSLVTATPTTVVATTTSPSVTAKLPPVAVKPTSPSVTTTPTDMSKNHHNYYNSVPPLLDPPHQQYRSSSSNPVLNMQPQPIPTTQTYYNQPKMPPKKSNNMPKTTFYSCTTENCLKRSYVESNILQGVDGNRPGNNNYSSFVTLPLNMWEYWTGDNTSSIKTYISGLRRNSEKLVRIKQLTVRLSNLQIIEEYNNECMNNPYMHAVVFENDATSEIRCYQNIRPANHHCMSTNGCVMGYISSGDITRGNVGILSSDKLFNSVDKVRTWTSKSDPIEYSANCDTNVWFRIPDFHKSPEIVHQLPLSGNFTYTSKKTTYTSNPPTQHIPLITCGVLHIGIPRVCDSSNEPKKFKVHFLMEQEMQFEFRYRGPNERVVKLDEHIPIGNILNDIDLEPPHTC
ncbi:polyhedrin [Carcinus maenas nudivirus]|uniref:Polyhedrin n=1 Tax=Carcinus maenas nudivirus TaxID=2880837 RepID=A0AAE8Y0L3_9VIRU|nr:polyhedrin [Carcinus maenas nudivirus]UBZ25685.1 polyhedrin [Carcinus maenas nudivirus]